MRQAQGERRVAVGERSDPRPVKLSSDINKIVTVFCFKHFSKVASDYGGSRTKDGMQDRGAINLDVFENDGREFFLENDPLLTNMSANINASKRVDFNGSFESDFTDLEDEFENASFFSKLTNRQRKKKYASLFYLQGEVLSIKEKGRRYRAIEKSRKFGNENRSLNVSRHSSSDADIARNQRLKQSAKKALELGKKIGIQFIGDEDEILEDFVTTKLREQ
ncbi:hypothetical protein V6N11_042235 [Hibiscus sabdariffa]|uniref:Uncharacterized protein n=1 Tax=Hibiscus sabdariffa TaxID=183260 RepID=A0ABR2QW85_9ROSI